MLYTVYGVEALEAEVLGIDISTGEAMSLSPTLDFDTDLT